MWLTKVELIAFSILIAYGAAAIYWVVHFFISSAIINRRLKRKELIKKRTAGIKKSLKARWKLYSNW